MVKAPTPATRDRLIAAAAAEFAARGFDGAKVDRIAARARVNKAMLYYHFDSKAALYRDILRGLFGAVGRSVADVRHAGGSPEHQIRKFIEVIAREAIGRPHFPAMWLREIGEGGRHLDASIVAEMRQVIETLAAILAEGRAAGVFVEAHPLVTHMAIVAPLLLFVASAPVRARFSHLVPGQFAMPPLDAVVTHVQAATLSVLRPARKTADAPVRRRRS